MTSTSIYYVYRISNLVEKKHYYGFRICKTQDPKDDIGKRYFSSSTDKEFLIDQKLNPQNYRYKVVAKFDNKVAAALREVKLHKKFNVRTNPNFYNRTNASSNGHNWYGVCREVSSETRAKLSNALMGKPRSEETKAKIAKKNSGRIRTEESKLKQSLAKKGKPGHTHTEETKAKLAELQRGKRYSAESRQKMSEAAKNRKH